MNELQKQLINKEIEKTKNIIAELEEEKRLCGLRSEELQNSIDKLSSDINELQKGDLK